MTGYSPNWAKIGPTPPATTRSPVLGTDGELHHVGDPTAEFTIKASAPAPPVIDVYQSGDDVVAEDDDSTWRPFVAFTTDLLKQRRAQPPALGDDAR